MNHEKTHNPIVRTSTLSICHAAHEVGRADVTIRAKHLGFTSLPTIGAKPKKRKRPDSGSRSCPNRLCKAGVEGLQAAHLCEHGNDCKYHQDETGRVVSWVHAECQACNSRRLLGGSQ
jgi:hypothetical protein